MIHIKTHRSKSGGHQDVLHIQPSNKMKVLFCFLFLTTIFAQACRTLTSQTFIEPGKSFVLGEGTHGAFRAKVKNTGTAAVEVAKESLEGNKTTVAVLAPGDETRVTIGNDTKAIFKNTGTEKATLDLYVSGDIGLSMANKTSE
jgi:hypothetical protein